MSDLMHRLGALQLVSSRDSLSPPCSTTALAFEISSVISGISSSAMVTLEPHVPRSTLTFAHSQRLSP